jgi:hypothetical protein
MDQRKLSVFQVHTQLKKSEILGAKLNTSKTWRSISVTFGVFLVILGSLTAVAVGTGLNTTCTGVGQLENGGFESSSSNWSTTATNGAIEIWSGLTAGPNVTDISNPSDATSHSGSRIVELQADAVGGANQGIYQDIATRPGSVIRYSFWHHARSGGGSSQNQQVTVRIGAIPNPDPAAGGWTSAEQSTASSSFGTQGVTSSVAVSQAWTQASGNYTVPAGQTTTRFLFVSLANGGSNSYGNLLDDIVFSPTLACPDETSVIVNRSAVTFSPIANDFRPNADNTLTIVSTTGTGTATVNGTNLQLSSTTVGSFTVRYRLTNSFGDTSQANVVVNVLSESTPRLPDVLLVDPRLNVVDFPQTTFENATNLLVCVQESDSGGSILGSPTVSFDVATKGTTETSGSGSATISGDRTSTLLIRHTRQNVLDTFNSSGGLRAYLSSGNFNSTRYVRVRTMPVATSTTAVTVASCADAAASASKTIEIRPLELTKTLRKGTIQLKN